jgi:hypothetical protein
VTALDINRSIRRIVTRTNFARTGLTVEQHAAAVRKSAATSKQIPSKGLAGLHGLQGEITTHRLGNVIAVFAALDALLCNVLNLGSPVDVLAIYVSVGESTLTGSGTISGQNAQSC